ncbi:hypothetical protein H0R92_09455 [Treponema sp. OMZ 840]|uniref:hypothetical protein n=1 Tax=Treponema sp. OMZ 840 TaxID=244313 RepID=UPI003D93076F
MKNLMNIHDANITGILIEGEKNIRLILEGSAKKTLIFTNAIRMKIDNFQMGNILLDISILNDLSTHTELCNSLCFLYDIEAHELQNEWAKAVIKKIESKSLIIVELIESCGAHGAILCEAYAEKSG